MARIIRGLTPPARRLSPSSRSLGATQLAHTKLAVATFLCSSCPKCVENSKAGKGSGERQKLAKTRTRGKMGGNSRTPTGRAQAALLEHRAMGRQGVWRQVLGCWLLAAGLSGAPGCMSSLHRLEPTLPELKASCRELPKCCRDHVYIFIIHGLDPLDYANLAGVRDYFHELGFKQTYFGQLYHTSSFNKEIRRIHREDPEARFVLIGFSFGANMVRSLTQDVKDEGIHIDLLVYLGGNTLKNVPQDRPDNAGRIVNILASGFIWNGAWLDGADNIHETDVWHFGSPAHPRTMQVLTENLSAVASSVPVMEPAEPKALSDEEPTPRSVTTPAAGQRDAWDFLKPVSNLPQAPEPSQQIGPTHSPPSADQAAMKEAGIKASTH